MAFLRIGQPICHCAGEYIRVAHGNIELIQDEECIAPCCKRWIMCGGAFEEFEQIVGFGVSVLVFEQKTFEQLFDALLCVKADLIKELLYVKNACCAQDLLAHR